MVEVKYYPRGPCTIYTPKNAQGAGVYSTTRLDNAWVFAGEYASRRGADRGYFKLTVDYWSEGGYPTFADHDGIFGGGLLVEDWLAFRRAWSRCPRSRSA